MKIEIEAEPLFEFASHREWVNKARSWFANCGVRSHQLISVDSIGRVCPNGAEFMRADAEGTFPIRVYQVAGSPPLADRPPVFVN